MTNDEVGRAYQQLLTSEPDVLEEGAAFAEADVPRRKVAQGWLALSQSLWVDAQGARGDNLVRVRAQRQQALVVAYLLAKGADPAQIPTLAVPVVPAAAPQTLVDNLVVAMRKALPLLPGEIALQVQELLSPGSIAVMGGAFAGWAVAHAFGVGAVADLLVGALGLNSSRLAKVMLMRENASSAAAAVSPPAGAAPVRPPRCGWACSLRRRCRPRLRTCSSAPTGPPCPRSATARRRPCWGPSRATTTNLSDDAPPVKHCACAPQVRSGALPKKGWGQANA